MADKQPAEEGEEETPKSGGGLMGSLPLVVIAGLASFGMVWFISTPPPVEEYYEDDEYVPECEVVEHDEPDPEELAARAAKYVSLEPITVSLGPDAGAKHLRISLALGTPDDSEELTEVEFLRLRDQFLEQLRTADLQLIKDPKAMPTLKAMLLAKAQSTLGQDEVYSVLITDFLMK